MGPSQGNRRMLDGHEALNGHELFCNSHSVGGGCQGTHLEDSMTRLRMLWRMYRITHRCLSPPSP